MAFAADKYSAEFGGVKMYVEEYSFARSAAVGETVLNNGTVSIHNGGGKAVRIMLSGTSAVPCADLLDTLLCSGEKLTLTYGKMVFTDIMLTDYKCIGTSGCAEHVTAEFASAKPVTAEEAEK